MERVRGSHYTSLGKARCEPASHASRGLIRQYFGDKSSKRLCFPIGSNPNDIIEAFHGTTTQHDLLLGFVVQNCKIFWYSLWNKCSEVIFNQSYSSKWIFSIDIQLKLKLTISSFSFLKAYFHPSSSLHFLSGGLEAAEKLGLLSAPVK